MGRRRRGRRGRPIPAVAPHRPRKGPRARHARHRRRHRPRPPTQRVRRRKPLTRSLFSTPRRSPLLPEEGVEHGESGAARPQPGRETRDGGRHRGVPRLAAGARIPGARPTRAPSHGASPTPAGRARAAAAAEAAVRADPGAARRAGREPPPGRWGAGRGLPPRHTRTSPQGATPTRAAGGGPRRAESPSGHTVATHAPPTRSRAGGNATPGRVRREAAHRRQRGWPWPGEETRGGGPPDTSSSLPARHTQPRNTPSRQRSHPLVLSGLHSQVAAGGRRRRRRRRHHPDPGRRAEAGRAHRQPTPGVCA